MNYFLRLIVFFGLSEFIYLQLRFFDPFCPVPGLERPGTAFRSAATLT